MKRRLVAVAVLASVVVAGAPAAAHAFGEGFGAADSQGPALPGEKAFWAATCDLRSDATEIGSAPAAPRDCIDTGTPNLSPGLQVWAMPPQWRLNADAIAGGHPDGTSMFWLNRSELTTTAGIPAPDGNVRNAFVGLPAGFVGDPTAVPRCPSEAARQYAQCPPETQVGLASTVFVDIFGLSHEVRPVYNVEPRRGKTAELMISAAGGFTNVPIVADVRTSGDFGVDAKGIRLPTGFPVHATQVTIWGVPWAAEHDRWRPARGHTLRLPLAGLSEAERVAYDPSWGEIRPFVANLTECTGAPVETGLSIDSWQNLDVFHRYSSPASAMTGCADLPFDPSTAVQPTSTTADTATGLEVDISIPQNRAAPYAPPAEGADQGDVEDYVSAATAYWKSPAGRATSHLDRTVVQLPDGLTANPSGATGLRSCSDAQVGVIDPHANPKLFNEEDPFDGKGQECPPGSVIGTVEARTPLLEERLTGQLALGEPESTDPASGKMLRLFLVARNEDRGLLAKVFGTAVADPRTGRLTATFDKNPRVPVERIEVSLKGGSRGLLATPRSCGTHRAETTLTPWSAAHGAGGTPKTATSLIAIGGCASSFAPTLAAGMDSRAARGSGTFSFRFSRRDGEQYLRGLTARLPDGLLASVRGVPLCADADADAGHCPASSKIGIVDAKAGAGDPFVLEQKGEVFLTEGYRGGEYGLAVKIRPVAGPFRGQWELSPIIVRQAIHVDRTTAQVTAVSDPFPLIHHGVPLRVREVTVLVNRSGFMLNPSDCSQKQVGADISSDQGAISNASNAFQVSGCANLAYKPKLTLALTGRKQVTTGKHPGIKAMVTQQGVSEAGIEKAVVRLPKSLALDPDNAQALCEFADGTKDDLEKHCPKGSIVGRARAVSPLLNDPLVGNVYFVKNIRIDPKSGNQIRTLPMIIVALRGEIAINLRGESSTTKGGKLVNTFDDVPDAPVSQFNLNITGGKRGIIAVTRTRKAKINICASRQVAESDMDAQNGKRHDTDVRMKTPCTKRQVKKAKRVARKVARKAARG